MTHGLDKFSNFSTYVMQFPPMFGMSPSMALSMAIFAELICAALVVLGLFTRLALIPLIITMSVAFFMVHAMDPFQ